MEKYLKKFSTILLSRKMSSVKIADKQLLEKLSARIFLLTGTKLTQQQLLTICVSYSSENLDDLLTYISVQNRIWTDNEVERYYEENVEDFGEGSEKLSKNIDTILYGKMEQK